MRKMKLEIDGNDFDDIKSFYSEINRLVMQEENWKLGVSLDAFDDLLYGGFGSIKDFEELEFIWKNSDKSKNDLGLETTLAYYEEKLKRPEIFNREMIHQKMDALKSGRGQTYFEILLEIISSHNSIQLVLK